MKTVRALCCMGSALWLAVWAAGAQAAGAACGGHEGARTNWVVNAGAGRPIAPVVTAKAGHNASKEILPGRPDETNHLGYVCISNKLNCTVSAKDPDDHVCQGVVTGQVYNYILDTSLSVELTRTNSSSWGTISLVSTQSGDVIERQWSGDWDVPLEAAGHYVLLQYKGTIEDKRCPVHYPRSDDSDVDLYEYRARMGVLKLDLDVDANYDQSIGDDDDPIEVSDGGVVSLVKGWEAVIEQNGATVTNREPVWRRRVLIEKVKPEDWPGSVTLKKGDGGERVDVYKAADGGEKLQFTGDNVFANADLPKSVWVQGVATSAVARDVRLVLTTGSEGSCRDEIALTVLEADLDIDSDHTSDFEGPQRVDEEDAIEWSQPGPAPNQAHKYVVVNDYYQVGADTNAVPGYVDGYDLKTDYSPDDGMERPYGPVDNELFVPIAMSMFEPQGFAINWSGVTVTFTYDGAEPKAGPYVATENLRVWTAAQTVGRDKRPIPAGGNYVPFGVPIEAGKLGLPGSMTLYLEGLYESATLAGNAIRMTIGGIPGESAAECRFEDTVHCTVIRVDVDVDFDNDKGFEPPDRSPEEDRYEDMTNQVGKILVVNNGDKDGDGVPDYADGYNLLAGLAEDNVNTNERFAPIVFELAAPIDLDRARVRVTYPGSAPAAVVRVTNGVYRLPAEGSLRIWKRIGGAETRNSAAIPAGDYVAPGEYSARDFGFTGDVRVVTYYLEAVSNSTVKADQRILFEVDPDERDPHPSFIAADAVRVTTLAVEIVDVATDEVGLPVRVNGETVCTAVIDPFRESLSTYSGLPGHNRGIPGIETTASGGGCWVTLNVRGNTAELGLTHGDWDLCGSWNLRKTPGTELFDEYILIGDPEKTVRVKLAWFAAGSATTHLTVTIRDTDFTGMDQEITLGWDVFVPGSAASEYSNIRITGTGPDIGYPLPSTRNLAMIRIFPAVCGSAPNSFLGVTAEDDYTEHPLGLSLHGDGAYYSEIVVPMLQVPGSDASEFDGGPTINQEGIKILKFRTDGGDSNPNPTFKKVKFKISADIARSAQMVDKRRIPVQAAMMISAQITDETADRGEAVSGPGGFGPAGYAVKHLGVGVTPNFQPTLQDLQQQLERHRMWIHTGHGAFEKGVQVIGRRGDTPGQLGNEFSKEHLTVQHLRGDLGRYSLVFLSTCQSTDKFHKLHTDQRTWIEETDPTQHKVYDVGVVGLRARNYIGWDSNSLRPVSIKVPLLLMKALNGQGLGAAWRAPTVAAAVEAVRAELIDNPHHIMAPVYAEMLRLAVRSDDVRVDLNREK